MRCLDIIKHLANQQYLRPLYPEDKSLRSYKLPRLKVENGVAQRLFLYVSFQLLVDIKKV